MTIARRGTLLIVSGPRHDPDRKHLHVVCTDPDAAGDVLIVGLCSVTAAFHDATCILDAHEHDFLRHPSYVLYARAQIISADALRRGIAESLIVRHSDMNGQAFLKVRNSLCRSPFTPRKIKAYAGCTEPDEAPAS